MRVLLLAENWPPRVGGIEKYLTSIERHLPPDSVETVTPDKKRFFWPVIKPAWLPLFIWLYRQTRREKYDAVLCGKALFEGLAGYYLKKYSGVPYIVFTYAMEVEKWSSEPGEQKKLIKVLTNADRVVYINDITKELLLELGVNEKQLVKIWPGVDERFLRKASEQDLNRVLEAYAVERPYIVAVARLIARKGIDVLIDAFSRLDQTRFGNVDLVIVGEGEKENELKNLASHLFVEKSVKFLGLVPDEDLPALYQGAQLFALTPRRFADDMEGFGIVYLEAAAAGLAAVATDSGGAAEAVIHKKTGLVVEEGSPEAARQALEQLLADDSLRKRMGERARIRARREFVWSKQASLAEKMIYGVAKR